MHKIFKYFGKFLTLAALMVFIGYFSNRPIYNQFPEDKAQIKLGFTHGAARKIDCRKLSSKEIAKLPQNKRRPNNCTRERIPLYVQLALDGQLIYDAQLNASGLYSDGPAHAYKKFIVPTGPHTITVRLRDSKRASGFDYENSHYVVLEPLQNLAIDFRADVGGFQFN
jgi:hypothetical protein